MEKVLRNRGRNRSQAVSHDERLSSLPTHSPLRLFFLHCSATSPSIICFKEPSLKKSIKNQLHQLFTIPIQFKGSSKNIPFNFAEEDWRFKYIERPSWDHRARVPDSTKASGLSSHVQEEKKICSLYYN